jgi:hypothetical protein
MTMARFALGLIAIAAASAWGKTTRTCVAGTDKEKRCGHV